MPEKMIEKLMCKIKIWFQRWLFDKEYIMGIDYGVNDTEIIIICRNLRTGIIRVISEYNTKTDKELDFLIRELCNEYNVKYTIEDKLNVG